MSAGTAKPSIPYVTSEQMREVDRLMIEEYGILLMQMMENAGRHLAHLARQRFMDGDPVGKTVLVLAGAGGNGGGGLVAARRLHSWGARVIVYLPRPASELAEVPRHHFAILERLGVEIVASNGELKLTEADLIVDALIGIAYEATLPATPPRSSAPPTYIARLSWR